MSADFEAGQILRIFGDHVDPVDPRASRPLATELDEALHGVALSFQGRLDRSVRAVPHPPANAERLRSSPERLSEEDALDVTLHDHSPALHDPRLVATRFVEALSRACIGATFNQYTASPLLRKRLAVYLHERRRAPILLVGEAAGYRGARVSGLPFTSERQLTGSGPAEATATIVQRTLAELGLSADVLLWNLVPTHPGTVQSNRRPTAREIDGAAPFLAALAAGRRVIPVGRLAHRRLGGPYVRHPSHGGAAAFCAGLAAALV